MSRLRIILCLLLLQGVLCANEVPEKYRKWLDEEVVYIIAAQERADFKRLSSDTDREGFIEKFWKIRDTDTSTQDNEFKQEHYARIAHANERFSDGIPGWKSERGRIWILHGPPDDIHYDYGGGSIGIDIENPTEAITGDANPDRRRRYRLTINRPENEVWVYRRIEGATSAPSYFQVIFSRTSSTGVYQLNQLLKSLTAQGNLSYPQRLQRDSAIMNYLNSYNFGGPYRILYAGEYKFQDLDDFYQSIFHPLRLPTVTFADFQLGIEDLERSSGEVLMSKLARARELKERVGSRIFFEELPLNIQSQTLRTPSGSTMVLVSVGLPQADAEGHPLISRSDTLDLLLELVGPNGEAAATFMDSVRIPGDQDKERIPGALYQTRLAARAGSYRLEVYAALRDHRASHTSSLEVELPDYGDGVLSMSDLLFFDKVLPRDSYKEALRRLGDGPRLLGETHPVFLRDLALIPSVDGRFRRKDKLTAFFEVYNPAIPEGRQAPELKVKCRLRRSDGASQELPERVVDYITDTESNRTTYGISLPLLGFSIGRYSLEFDVHDPVKGLSVSRAAPFTVY